MDKISILYKTHIEMEVGLIPYNQKEYYDLIKKIDKYKFLLYDKESLHEKINKYKIVKISDHYENIIKKNIKKIKLPNEIIALEFETTESLCGIEIPESTLFLELPEWFDEDINYPPNLVYLKTGRCFNQSIDDLPPSLKILQLGSHFNCNLNNLPKGLEYLGIPIGSFDGKLDKLPPNLKVLDFGKEEEFDETKIKLNKLPENLQVLRLPLTYNKTLKNLPVNLKKLYLGYNYDKKLVKGSIPPYLEELVFNHNYDKDIPEGVIPKNTKKTNYFKDNNKESESELKSESESE